MPESVETPTTLLLFLGIDEESHESCCGEESATILSPMDVLGAAGAPKEEFFLGPTTTLSSLALYILRFL